MGRTGRARVLRPIPPARNAQGCVQLDSSACAVRTRNMTIFGAVARVLSAKSAAVGLLAWRFCCYWGTL